MGILDSTLARIKPPSRKAADGMRVRLDSLTKPRGSLGALEDLAVTVASALDLECTRDALRARIPFRKRICVAAGDHGVYAEGVAPYPQEVTAQMVANFASGGAAINQFAARIGSDVEVIDAGVATPLVGDVSRVVRTPIARGTANIARGRAMTREEAVRSIELGIAAAARARSAGVEFLGAGDMGIANTTPSTAMVAALTGRRPSELAGPGSGLEPEGVRRKALVVERALEVNRPDPKDPLDVLSKLGGFEIGCIAGMILGGAAEGMVVFADGLISSAGAAVAVLMAPGARGHVVWSHRSTEPAHAALCEKIGARPLVDLCLRLGEGTGAAIAMWLAETAVAVAAGMSTFGEAGVSDA